MIDLGVGSHLPWLALLVSRTTGPIVEFGVGAFSTTLLHVMGAMQGRPVTSYETNEGWFENYKGLECDLHHLELIQSWGVNWEIGRQWDVAFVDCSPGVKDRQDVSPRVDIIKRLKGLAKFIAAHDTEADVPPSAGAYGWANLNGFFKYQTVLDKFRPWTTVYSDTEEFRP